MAQPIKVKKVPMRKCVVTNEQHPKGEMFRIVRDPEGVVIIDTTGKAKGHGCYLVKNKKVILMAQKKKLLDRHLETSVPDEIYEQLVLLLEKEEGK